jgi:hypothetical protein
MSIHNKARKTLLSCACHWFLQCRSQKQVNSKVNDPYAYSAHYPCCCSAACLVTPAFAAKSSTGSADILAANNQYALYLQNTKMDYAETGGSHGSAPGLLDTENGNIPGFGLSATSMSDWALGNDYLQFDFNYSNGNTDYVVPPTVMPATVRSNQAALRISIITVPAMARASACPADHADPIYRTGSPPLGTWAVFHPG